METTWGWHGESGWTSELWRDDETAAAALVWEWECLQEVDGKYFVKMFCGCVCYYYGSQQLFLFLSYYVMFNFISEIILSFFDLGYLLLQRERRFAFSVLRKCCCHWIIFQIKNWNFLLSCTRLTQPTDDYARLCEELNGSRFVRLHQKSRVRGWFVCTLSITHKWWWRFSREKRNWKFS